MDDRHPAATRRHTFLGCNRAALALALVLATSGCATRLHGVVTPPHELQPTAAFYWQYASLAADVYQTAGRVDDSIVLSAGSSWLRAEVRESNNPALAIDFVAKLQSDLELLYTKHVQDKCTGKSGRFTQQGPDGALRASEGRCKTQGEADAEAEVARSERLAEPNRFTPTSPNTVEACRSLDGADPAVPVKAAMAEFGWERVPEFQRQSHPRAWSLFVPDLAIDIWRRRLPPRGESPVLEYAIVYRGTVGGGGWMSNLRGLTAFTPFVWDQYLQAEAATRSIVNQIYQLHALSDQFFERDAGTRVNITAVGHSLGAGLASYIFLKVAQITRVVGFHPSPLDGASMIKVNDRSTIMARRAQPVDRHDRAPDAAIFMLFEEGEVVSRFAQCHNGPMWGAEGGPVVRCESVDFSRGNIFRQHNMARLACKLYRAKLGLDVGDG